MYWIKSDGHLAPVVESDSPPTGRQQLPPAYALNGAVYVARSNWLRRTRTFLALETVPFLIDQSRSLDIDTEEDFRTCERIDGTRRH